MFINKFLLFQMRALSEKTSRRIHVSAARNSVWYLWCSLQNNNWTQIILNKTSSLIWIPNVWHCNDRTSGVDQDSMLGAQYLKHKVFSFERRRRETMLRDGGGGGSGGMLPRICFGKKGTIWCILGPILAFKILLFLLFLCFFICFFNVAFVDKSENKEKEEP